MSNPLSGGPPSKEYSLSLDMAKEISILRYLFRALDEHVIVDGKNYAGTFGQAVVKLNK